MENPGHIQEIFSLTTFVISGFPLDGDGATNSLKLFSALRLVENNSRHNNNKSAVCNKQNAVVLFSLPLKCI